MTQPISHTETLLGGQSSDAIAVTGGTIDNTPIGGSTRALVSCTYCAYSAADALTAAGTTRADALALTSSINRISTAAASTGVVLPASATVGIGGAVSVYNDGASAIKVYAAGSDTIDGTAGSTGVTLTNAKRCEYRVVAAGKFLSAQLGVTSA